MAQDRHQAAPLSWPGRTRRNITISHGDVLTTPGERLRIGDVDLEVVRVTAPCKLLDDVIGSGAHTVAPQAGRLRVPGTLFRDHRRRCSGTPRAPGMGADRSTAPSMATVVSCTGSMMSRCPTATWSHRRSSRGR